MSRSVIAHANPPWATGHEQPPKAGLVFPGRPPILDGNSFVEPLVVAEGTARIRVLTSIVAQLVALEARSFPSGPSFMGQSAALDEFDLRGVGDRVPLIARMELPATSGIGSCLSDRNIPHTFQKSKDLREEIAFYRRFHCGLEPVSRSIHDDQPMPNACARQRISHA